MSTVRFICTACKHPLEAEDSMVGDLVDCPNCKVQLQVPGKTARQPIGPVAEKSEVVLTGIDLPISQLFPVVFKVMICVIVIMAVIALVVFAFSFLGGFIFEAVQ